MSADFLDSAEFKAAMRAYWVSSLHWADRIDDIKALIRANYQPPPSRTIKKLQAKIEELQGWCDKLSEAHGEIGQ